MAGSHGARSPRWQGRLWGRGVLGLTLCGVVVAGPYNEKEAILYAYIATAAYCGKPKTNVSSLERWDCGQPCQQVPGMSHVRQILPPRGFDAYAFVGKLGWDCILSFRGTSNLHGWMEDLVSYRLVDIARYGINCTYGGLPCKVGDGFLASYLSIAGYIRGNLSAIGCRPGARLTVTGHSLGAAEAVLAMYDLMGRGYKIQQTYTFGQPRVGNDAFVAAFNKDIGPTTVYRVTYRRDPVVHLPWEGSGLLGHFRHVSREVFYNGTVAEGYRLCDISGEDRNCSAQFRGNFWLIAACRNLSACDHLHYMTAAKRSDMDGKTCTNGGDAPALLV